MRANTTPPMASADRAAPCRSRRACRAGSRVSGMTRAIPRQDQQADRHVEPERPPPADVGREPTADEGTDGRHPPDRRAVDGEGDGALSAGKDRVHRRQRGGQDHRGSHALNEPGEHEDRARSGEAGQDRGGQEDHHAEGEDPAASGEVADPADGEQQRREDQGVDGVHPLGLRGVQVQVGDDDGERDVDDRRVHDDEGHPERDRRERPPTPASEPLGRGWRAHGS